MEPTGLDPQNVSFGEALRSLRMHAPSPMSQRDLASALGYDPSFLSRIETGRVHAPKDFFDRLDGVEELQLSTRDREQLLQLHSIAQAASRGLSEPGRRSPFKGLLSDAFGPHLNQQASRDIEEKQTLAAYLAGQLERLGRSRAISIILDSGSLMGFLSEELATLFREDVQWEVHTGNLLAALLLSGSMPVHLLGGRIDSEFGATLSAESEDDLGRLIDRLTAEAIARPTEAAAPLGILSCAAFSAAEGPWSSLHGSSMSFAVSDRHLHWKCTLTGRLPWLILPLNPEKLLRPGKPKWKHIGPIQEAGVSHWKARLRRAAVQDGPVTHVVIALPEPHPFHRRQRILTEIATLLRTGDTPSFDVTTELRIPATGDPGANLLTVLDSETRKPIPCDRLDEILESRDRE